MGFEQIEYNIRFAATAGRFDASRFSICKDCNNKLFVILNIHYLRKLDAVKIISNTIGAVPKGIDFTLEIIHGYNHGVELLTLVRNELVNARIYCKEAVEYDEGITFLKVS